ncbi:MAG: hypothetical protein OXI59_19910 [Gemmatimonadota bacterium]|nr:hypothetical protein [Gemmatimonadota bacterium]
MKRDLFCYDTHGLARNCGIAPLEPNHSKHIVGHRRLEQLLGLFEIGARWLFNKNVFARIHAINSRLQNPFFIHNAIDDIEIGFAEHIFVICIYLRELVFFRNLIQAFFIEFANRAHLDITLQAMDIWIMRALTAPPSSDKSSF